VGTACFQLDIEQRCPRKTLPDMPQGQCFPASAALCGHLLALHGMAPNREIDATLHGFRRSGNKGQIVFLNAAGLELPGQLMVRAPILGHYQNAGGILVQTMNDSRPFFHTNALKFRAVIKDTVDQGAGSVPRGRVHDQISRLVDDQNIRILEENIKRQRFGHQVRGNRRRKAGCDGILDLDAVSGLGGLAVDLNKPLAYEQRRVGPGAIVQAPGDEGVQPLAGISGFDGIKKDVLNLLVPE
jgi:hypothetical protein